MPATCDREASLDHRQKKSENPSPEALNRQFTFTAYTEHLENEEALQARTIEDTRKRLRLLSCGTEAWIDFSPSTRRFRCRSNRCGLRVCSRCRFLWSQRLRERIKHAIDAIPKDHRKLVTLTLKANNAPLPVQVKNLWASLRKLRQRTLWKRSIRGAIAVLEITFNALSEKWHPHLHVVVDGSFIAQKKLSDQWCQVTCGSKIVDIRAIKEGDGPSKYLTAYLSKPPKLPPMGKEHKLAEYYETLENCHTFRTYGSMRPRNTEPPETKDDYPQDWIQLGAVCDLILAAVNGDDEASNILHAYHAQRHPTPGDTDDG